MASSDSDSQYEVDHILQQRKRRGTIEYLVRWKGFDSEEDSWEPLKNLQSCKDAISAFLKLQTPVKKVKKPRSQSRSRSRSRGRSPKARTRRSRSRSRSTSRGRTTKSKITESPSKKSHKTEVVTRTETNKSPGRMEKTTEIVLQTTKAKNPEETKAIQIVQSRREVQTVKKSVEEPEEEEEKRMSLNKFYDLWQTVDMAVLIVFICVSIIAISFVVERYVDSSSITNAVGGAFAAAVGGTKYVFARTWNATSEVWLSVTKFVAKSWKKITTN